MTITGQQVRAARALLGWSQEKLAGETGLSTTAIGKFEVGRNRPLAKSVSVIQRALEAAGVEFVDGDPGVRLETRAT